MPQDHYSHDHSHSHGHHAHGHAPARYDRAFALGVALNLGFVLIEAGFSVAANSMALLADAGHNLSDVLGLLLSWGAIWLERRQPTGQRTYGYGRSSILAALANSMILLIAVGAIAWEAVLRIATPEPVAGGMVMVVAACGIVVNGLTVWLFMAGREHDLNIRSSFLHMAADTVVSAGVVIAGLAIRITGWEWLDPATSLVISAAITVGTWRLLVSAVNLALDAVPDTIERAEVERYLEGLPGVVEVHDLHIWGLSTTESALTAHLVRPEGSAAADDAMLDRMRREISARFGINHATFQFECGDPAHPCPLAPHDVV